MANFIADILPIGYEGFTGYNGTTPFKVTHGSFKATCDRVKKVLIKYRLPFEEVTENGRFYIRQTGEPMKATRNKRTVKVKIKETIQCRELPDGRYEWTNTRSGRISIASFAYCPVRQAAIEAEAKKAIEARMLTMESSYHDSKGGLSAYMRGTL